MTVQPLTPGPSSWSSHWTCGVLAAQAEAAAAAAVGAAAAAAAVPEGLGLTANGRKRACALWQSDQPSAVTNSAAGTGIPAMCVHVQSCWGQAQSNTTRRPFVDFRSYRYTCGYVRTYLLEYLRRHRRGGSVTSLRGTTRVVRTCKQALAGC